MVDRQMEHPSLSPEGLLDNNAERWNRRPEEERFASWTPLATILIQSVGPMMYSVGNALHDAVDMLLISTALGQESLQIVAFSGIVRYLVRATAALFAQGTAARISGLIGEKRKHEAEQVVADMYRLTLILMIISPVVFRFASVPMLIFMGCTEEVAESSLDYLLPILVVAPFTGIYQMGCGFLQSEGRSIANGFMQLGAFLLNCGIFAPLFLFELKVTLPFAGVPFALSQVIPGTVLTILIFAGKFNLKPKCGQLCKGMSKETWVAVKLAIPGFLNVLAGAFPPMLLMNYMMSAATEQGVAGPVASAFSVFLKVQTFANAFSIGISQGFIAAGSFAFSTDNRMRVVWLLICTVILSFLTIVIFTPIMILTPESAASIWITDDDGLWYAKRMLPIPFYVDLFNAFNDTTVAFLLILRYEWLAMVPSITRTISFLVGALVLHETDPTSTVRMMWSFAINDIVVLVADVIIIAYPMSRFMSSIKIRAIP